MSDVEGPIFTGGEYKGTLPEGSFGQLLFNNFILKKDPDAVDHINGATKETMTNQQFLQVTYKIAAALKNLGVRTGDLVVISGENSFRNSAAATACILINATFAPLDPNLKPFELQNILENYRPHYYFCNKAQSEDVYNVLTALDLSASIVLFDQNESQDDRFIGFSFILEQSDTAIEPTSVSDPANELVAVMPSSGSTGLPKGVAISHRALKYVTVNMAAAFKVYDLGTFLQSSHLFWISGLYSLIMSCAGQPRVFLPRIDTAEILSAIKNYKIGFLILSPTFITTLLKKQDLDPNVFASVKMLGSMGGPLTEFITEALKKLPSPPLLAHSYGLTENVSGVTRFVPGMDTKCVGKVDVGMKVKIVDPSTGKILKQGETGEILVLSEYQMSGYYGNPEATKAAYDSEGWLRTGDLGYFNTDEFLYLAGRMKNVIKYRNLQISPEEIESLLIRMKGVLDVAVDGYPNSDDQYHALALVVKSPGASITEDQVKDYVKDHMSSHNCLRGGVFFVDTIPRTVHKKVSRVQVRELAYKLYKERQS